MGLRSRLKSRVKRAIGRDEPAPSPAPAARRAAAPNGTAPTSSATPEPKVVKATPAPKPAAPAAAQKPAAPKAAAKPADPEEAKKQERAAKHFEKTRKAVLKKLDELGGQSQLADLHDYSERRYFIAHRRFSDLMEGLVAEGLLNFDHSTGEATITDDGRAYIEA